MPTLKTQPIGMTGTDSKLGALMVTAERDGYDMIRAEQIVDACPPHSAPQSMEQLAAWIKNAKQQIELERKAKAIHEEAIETHRENIRAIERNMAQLRELFMSGLRVHGGKWTGMFFRGHISHSRSLETPVTCNLDRPDHRGVHWEQPECIDAVVAEAVVPEDFLKRTVERNAGAIKEWHGEWRKWNKDHPHDAQELPGYFREVEKPYPQVVAKAPNKG